MVGIGLLLALATIMIAFSGALTRSTDLEAQADAEVAALASVASLFVGLQDRIAAPTSTTRVMAAQSCLFAGAVLIAGLFSDLWVVPAVVLASAAAIAGLVGEHDPVVSRMFGDVMPVSAFLGLSTVDDRAAIQAAAAVLLAGAAVVAAPNWEGKLFEEDGWPVVWRQADSASIRPCP